MLIRQLWDPSASEAILPEARGNEPGALLVRAAVRVQPLAALEQVDMPSRTGALVIAKFARLRPRLLAKSPDLLTRLRSERHTRALTVWRAERLFV
jgi:hypothetical protein